MWEEKIMQFMYSNMLLMFSFPKDILFSSVSKETKRNEKNK